MHSSMTLSSLFALFIAMVILAAIPSVSVLAVSTRSAMSGFIHGVFTTLGIVLGDILFIILAIWGLSFLAETMGHLFVFINYIGGIYLIGLGIGLYRSQAKELQATEVAKSSLLSSFLTGLLITLGDQKATLFYLGFFPAFLDVSQISYVDTGIIIAIAIAAVGSVKLVYAWMANRARLLIRSTVQRRLNRLAGSVLIVIGIVLIARAR